MRNRKTSQQAAFFIFSASFLISGGAWASGDFVIRGEQSKSLLSEAPVESKINLSSMEDYLTQEAQDELRTMLSEIDKLLEAPDGGSADATSGVKLSLKPTQESTRGERP
ncbi:MAG: hypothetical protein RIR26_1455 [Pseudomonadota bacterium]|jgi:hypothetical protein